MKIYQPESIQTCKLIDVPSAWKGLELIIPDIIKRFNIKNQVALEFGCEFGYSTAALANYFNLVIAVDTFEGDIHSGKRESFFNQTEENLKDYSNIKLIQSKAQDYIQSDDSKYDLIHIDIVHTFDDTYEVGKWALEHSNVVIFHDTESFQDVMRACLHLEQDFNCKFYNYPYCNGLGILVR